MQKQINIIIIKIFNERKIVANSKVNQSSTRNIEDYIKILCT